jgi:diaminopimelate decarboxylase
MQHPRELEAALDARIREIHVESIEEAHTINQLAAARNAVADIAVRVNPVDASGGAMRMGGKPSPFGVDEEDLDVFLDVSAGLSNLHITGVHLFMGTQILDPPILQVQYHKALSIARRVASGWVGRWNRSTLEAAGDSQFPARTGTGPVAG